MEIDDLPWRGGLGSSHSPWMPPAALNSKVSKPGAIVRAFSKLNPLASPSLQRPFDLRALTGQSRFAGTHSGGHAARLRGEEDLCASVDLANASR